MKSLFFFALIIASGLISCNKFLDTEPTDSVAPDFYYNTEAQLNSALIGVYDPLSQTDMYADFMFNQLGSCTDEGFYARNITTGMQVYNVDYTNPDVGKFWKTLYKGIERANLLITNINKPAMDESKRKELLGQALFLRGYYYFLLVSNFGDVPLKIEPTSSVIKVDIPRTSTKEVYAQIIKDMETAEGMVDAENIAGTSSRIHKTTVQGILARVCLTMAGFPLKDNSQYANALKWADKVVASGKHSLNPKYDQIFINYMADKYDTRESLWEAEFSGNAADAWREVSRIGNTIGISCGDMNIGYSYGFINTTGTLFQLYEPGDLRKNWCIAPFHYVGSVKVDWTDSDIYNRNCGKYRREYEKVTPKNKNSTPTNFPLLRYADILLMQAEAENQVSGPTTKAFNAINMVRRRGFGKDVNIPDATADLPSELNKVQFQKVIQDERARELCFESLRRPDLIRWNIFIETMKATSSDITANAPSNYKFAATGGNNVSERNLLFPIPADEISLNKAMTQNPGY